MTEETAKYNAGAEENPLNDLLEMHARNDKHETGGFFTEFLDLVSRGEKIPDHWLEFIALILVNAAGARRSNEKNPVADALGIGNYRNKDIRNERIALAVGLCMRVDGINRDKAKKKVCKLLKKQGVDLSANRVGEIYNDFFNPKLEQWCDDAGEDDSFLDDILGRKENIERLKGIQRVDGTPLLFD